MQTSANINSLFEIDKRLAFLLLCLVTFLLLFAKKAFIESETAVFEFLQDRPEGATLRLIDFIQYVSIPIIYLWKFTVIGFVIWVGSFTFGYKITFNQCWGIAIVAEFVFIIPELIKIAWFLSIDTDPSYNSVRSFYPLALINLVDFDTLDKQYAYPLKALNVFEILYWLLLMSGIQHFAKRSYSVARKIVFFSYVILFFAWLGFYIMIYK